MRLVVRRVGVLSVPAAREINLSADAIRAFLSRQLVELGRDSIEIKAEEGDGLLSKAACIVGTQGRVTTQHTEIIGEGSCRSWSVTEQIIDYCTAGQAREASIIPLEIKMREPISRLVLGNRNRGTFTLAEVRGVGSESEITAAEN